MRKMGERYQATHPRSRSLISSRAGVQTQPLNAFQHWAADHPSSHPWLVLFAPFPSCPPSNGGSSPGLCVAAFWVDTRTQQLPLIQTPTPKSTSLVWPSIYAPDPGCNSPPHWASNVNVPRHPQMSAQKSPSLTQLMASPAINEQSLSVVKSWTLYFLNYINV